MELWAAGFNGWGQLNWEGEQSEAHDINNFKCCVRDTFVELLWNSISATLIRKSSGLQCAGQPDSLTQLFLKCPALCSSTAVAGNDRIIQIRERGIIEFLSQGEYLKQNGLVFENLKNIVQIAAGQTFFTALSEAGDVWSWGDGRYEACLGREVTDEHPAAVPSLIEDLSDLPTGPIRKISSGGYVTAALTAGNDLYIWGGRPGQQKLLEQLSGMPTPVDLAGEDIQDVAVGIDHILALTVTKRLFVTGSGNNGQLGLDVKQVNGWKEVRLPLKDNQRVFKVHAGYKCSFMIIEDIS